VPRVREYACLVIEVSDAGKRLLAEIVGDRLNGPKVLYDAWTAGQISDGDLRVLIPDTWLYVDWPERIIGAGNWVRLFRVAGFLSIPYGLPRPDSAITVFRGATAERRAGMSWTTDIDRADQFRQRHSWHAPTAVYRAVVTPDAVLALLERRGEGPPEVVVDPRMLTAVEQVGPLHPQRSTRTDDLRAAHEHDPGIRRPPGDLAARICGSRSPLRRFPSFCRHARTCPPRGRVA
jgi:hypothetical protein